MKTVLSFAAALLATGAGAMLPASAADAQRYRGDYYGRADYRGRGDYVGRDDRYAEYGRDDRGYRGGYERDRYDRRCNDGTTGTILGAIAGGLLGRTIDTRGDRTLGTVLGGAGGALAGHAIQRSGNPRYCR